MAIDTKLPAFLLTNYAEDATITATEEAASHDADELKTASYVKTYRTTGVSADRIITFDLLESKALDAFVLWGVNLTDAATLEWETSNNSGFTPLIHNPGAGAAFVTSREPYVPDAPPWGRPAVYLVPDGTTGRYVRVRLTDTANGDGFLEAAHAFIGPVRQPSHFMAGDWSQSVEFIGPPGRSVPLVVNQVRLKAVDEAARRGVLSLERALMATGRFGFIPRPGDSAATVAEATLCQLARPVESLAYQSGGSTVWDLTLTMREIRG